MLGFDEENVSIINNPCCAGHIIRFRKYCRVLHTNLFSSLKFKHNFSSSKYFQLYLQGRQSKYWLDDGGVSHLVVIKGA